MPKPANPYSDKIPIHTQQGFFGRATELDLIRQAIQTPACKCLSLVGEGRRGLSSLMHRVMSREFQDSCQSRAKLQFMAINCKLYQDPLPLIRDLLMFLTRDVDLDGIATWEELQDEWLDALNDRHDTKLVLLFDDFEYIGRNETFADWIESLRASAFTYDFCLITTSHTALHRACHNRVVSSPFPNIFAVRYLSPFSAQEAAGLVAAHSQASGVDLTGYADQLFELSGGFPALLQIAGSFYFQELAETGSVDAEKISIQFVNAARPVFDAIWRELEIYERVALLNLSQHNLLDDGIKSVVLKGYVNGAGRLFSRPFAEYVSSIQDT